MSDKLMTGREGEGFAAKALEGKGYRIIDMNFRSVFGEIDIIAEEGGCLVFVEVKRRRNRSFGTSFEAIDSRKKRHIIRSAQFYLKSNHYSMDRRIRFDVVGIDGDEIKIVQGAFGEGEAR